MTVYGSPVSIYQKGESPLVLSMQDTVIWKGNSDRPFGPTFLKILISNEKTIVKVDTLHGCHRQKKPTTRDPPPPDTQQASKAPSARAAAQLKANTVQVVTAPVAPPSTAKPVPFMNQRFCKPLGTVFSWDWICRR